MPYCSNCGKQYTEETRYCPSCGTPNMSSSYAQNTPGSPAQNVQNEKVMGILAYLGPLVLVPIFAEKDSSFVRFHANQGLVLFIIEIALSVASSVVSGIGHWLFYGLGVLFSCLFGLVWLLVLVPVIMGIISAVNGEMKPLPLIGGIKILK